MAIQRDLPDDQTLSHARSLFGAISLMLSTSGCAPQTMPPPTENVVVVPPASGAPVGMIAPLDAAPAITPVASASSAAPETSASEAPIASVAPPPRASASARVKKNPQKVVTPVKQPLIIDVEGRPFLVDGTARVAALQSCTGWADVVHVDGSPNRAEREALVRHYTDWALAEHASIASFARFSLQLLALGAPSDLVRRATQAMADETRHARFGFGLVHAFSGTTLGPGALAIDRAFEDETTLQSVLRLTVREGMIGETLAALEVRSAADLVEIPSLRDALAVIAEDESRHAELAYAFAAWALQQSPELASVIEAEVVSWSAPALPTAAGLDRWGILDEPKRRRVRETGFTNVVRPLMTQLTQRAVA